MWVLTGQLRLSVLVRILALMPQRSPSRAVDGNGDLLRTHGRVSNPTPNGCDHRS